MTNTATDTSAALALCFCRDHCGRTATETCKTVEMRRRIVAARQRAAAKA